MFDRKACIGCGASISKTATFCPRCGSKQARSMSEEEVKKNPFKILQVSPDAEDEVINAAYRGLARKYHPDVNSSPIASERMKEINWAYQILGDLTKRAEYERSRTKSTAQRAEPSEPRPSQPRPSQRTSRTDRDTTSSQSKRDYSQRRSTYSQKPTSKKRDAPSRMIVAGFIVFIICIWLFSLIDNSSYLLSTTNTQPTTQVLPSSIGNPTQQDCNFSDVETWMENAVARYNASSTDWDSWDENSPPAYIMDLMNNAQMRYLETKVQTAPSCLKELQKIDLQFYFTETKLYEALLSGNDTAVPTFWARCNELNEEFNNELERIAQKYGWD